MSCVTHHHGCDCREAAICKLVNDLFKLAVDGRNIDNMVEGETWWRRNLALSDEANRLGITRKGKP